MLPVTMHVFRPARGFGIKEVNPPMPELKVVAKKNDGR